MALPRRIDGLDPVRAEPMARRDGAQQKRRATRSGHLASGTLACPACDVPVAPAAFPCSPADPLRCPFCAHAAAVRDFLSLAVPSRPARVEVRVVQRRRPRAATA